MIKWFKRGQDSKSSDSVVHEDPIDNKDNLESGEKPGLFARLKRGLAKTRHQLGDGIGRLLLGKKEISQDLLEELETLLISADLGLDTTQEVLKHLTEALERKQLTDGDAVYAALKSHLENIIAPKTQALDIETQDASPFVILMVGVNGAGKTTTIGKLAKQFQSQGKKVMLAAGDTFRAAAVEQLQVWGERNGIPVIAQHTGADSASVIFDALQAAKARKIDVLIADTAGRLHTQGNLMEELKKVKRVLHKIDPEAPHETMLVLDASIGQNALVQAKQFHQAVKVTGITMTKLDGTAKGGDTLSLFGCW
jgi:fused signal recognition particle receptor